MDRKKILWITQTAAMLALLIALQWAGGHILEPITKQLVTGTFVNTVLAVTVLMVGMSSGITVALVSPIFAFLFKIAPVFLAVPIIMVGNVCYVVLLRLIVGKTAAPIWRKPVALGVAAAAKFGALYLLGVELVCGVLAPNLQGKALGSITLMTPKILKQLMTMFSWPQLVTALIGGTLALLVVPVLRKALHK